MDNRLQATFMPRQPAVSGDAYARPKGPHSFFKMIGVLVFVLALVAMGGLFAYKKYITGNNGEKQTKVEEAIKNFEPELTRELTILKARVDAGKGLLENHKAFSLLFTLLELNTAQTVQFNEFSFVVSPDKKIKLTMKGEARSYNAIAFQSDVFSKVEQFKSPMFTNLAINEQGIISFDFSAELDPAAVSYKKLTAGFVFLPASVATTTQNISAPAQGATTTQNMATTTQGAAAVQSNATSTRTGTSTTSAP